MAENLNSLKRKYWNIYQSEVHNITFTWRELSRGEYSRIVRLFPNDFDREDEICKLCVIEPTPFDYENEIAGLASVLSSHILKESGFGNEPSGKITTKLNKFRQEMKSFENQVSCIIHEAFSNIDLEEIEDWNLDKTLWYFSRAEYILNDLRGIGLTNQNNTSNQGTTMGDSKDFPELAAEKAFMQGKMR